MDISAEVSRVPFPLLSRAVAVTATLRLLIVLLFCPTAGLAQTALSVFSDQLDNGFQDWSWGTRNFENTSPTHTGNRSIRFSGNTWEAISFYHSDLDTSFYDSFTFWVNGGSGGQRIQVYADLGDNFGPTYVVPGVLPANSWQLVSIPLDTLGIADIPNLNRITIQLRNDGASGAFYLDDILFTAKPPPEIVNVSIDAGQVVSVADERHFGVNLAMWDQYFDPPYDVTSSELLQELGATVVRMPGGSLSDEYHWMSNTTLSNTWQWANSFADMVRVATNVGAQAFITVNYGSGTPEEAAAWVRHANITNQLGYKYWEIGNECYGPWETDTNSRPNDAFTYALRAAVYMSQMRAADPNIKIGVVAVPGEDSYSNDYIDHPTFNPRTGGIHYGWTPVMLATLSDLGVKPDFLVHHHYPQWTGANNPSPSSNSDTTLLQSTGNWAVDAADLRRQISDYFGPEGDDIELVVTENNSDAGAQGRQSTSLVNGIYYADSLGQLLQTEFRGFVWWDFRNAMDQTGNFGSHLYGWRDYGDLGMVNGPSTRHPTFYAAKLMRWFARPGDEIVSASSDYNWISAFTCRRTNGSLSLLLLNKSLVTNLNVDIRINGYRPNPAATLRSYGIPQDEAARTNASLTAQDIASAEFTVPGTNFVVTLPRLSMNLLTLIPESPKLGAGLGIPPGEVILTLEGQAGVPYVLQASTNLIYWEPMWTNRMTTACSITNVTTADASMKFWRAVWRP